MLIFSYFGSQICLMGFLVIILVFLFVFQSLCILYIYLIYPPIISFNFLRLGILRVQKLHSPIFQDKNRNLGTWGCFFNFCMMVQGKRGHHLSVISCSGNILVVSIWGIDPTSIAKKSHKKTTKAMNMIFCKFDQKFFRQLLK